MSVYKTKTGTLASWLVTRLVGLDVFTALHQILLACLGFALVTNPANTSGHVADDENGGNDNGRRGHEAHEARTNRPSSILGNLRNRGR